MKNFTLGTMMVALSLGLNAQNAVQDSIIMGASYANEVYYKLADGAKSEHLATDWHLGFSTEAYSATIITNAGHPSPGMGAAGMSIAVWPGGTNASFATVDTAGFSTWPKLYDDSLDFSIGAFNKNSIGGMDYGWGAYNISTHVISGDSVYIIKVGSVAYKLDIIKKQSGTYTFRYANVADGGNGTEVTINASTTYGTKDFVFFNLVDGQIKDRELADWDLWAVKYYDVYNGTAPNQSVVGILTNPKWEVAVVEVGAGNQASHTDFLSGNFSDHKNELGQSYKGLNAQYQWVVTNTKVYYLQNTSGDVWKWYPTSFVGTSQGKTVFYKEQLAFAGIENTGIQFVDIYPNPAQDQLTIVFDSKGTSADIIIRNQMGQVVSMNNMNTTPGVAQQKMDVSALTNGLYFVEVNQNGNTTVKSVVKY
jgi:hypothetical protein